MKVLVLGGTRFAGRAIVEALASRGHDVTCFHRGNNSAELPAGVRETFGDRNEPLPAALEQAWDAVVDVSGQLPDQVRRTAALDANRYLFISTLSVYRDNSQIGVDETAATIHEFDPSDAAAAYGGNKTACEEIVVEKFGDRATILRPGIIVGPWDYTGRFSYWPKRASHGGRFIVPAPPERAMQFVDARDLAEFALHAVENAIGGRFNVIGPEQPYTFGELIDACVKAAAERGVRAEPIYIDGTAIFAAGVEPWTDLPMWIDEPQYAGLFTASNRRAVAAGLRFRAPIETIRALLDWVATPPGAAVQAGLSLEREAEVLAQKEAL